MFQFEAEAARLPGDLQLHHLGGDHAVPFRSRLQGFRPPPLPSPAIGRQPARWFA